MASGLIQLATIILQNAQEIDRRCNELGQTFPSLDAPFSPQSNAVLHDPSVAQSTARMISATIQLTATAQSPVSSTLDTAYGFLLSAALRIASISGVPDFLSKDPETMARGACLQDLAVQAKMDPGKLARVLRALSTRHIFREPEPNVFAHNRISSLLITKRSPEERYKGTPGLYSVVDWLTDEVFKGAGYLAEAFLENVAVTSPTTSAFNRAFNVDTDVFTWYELPENKSRFECFSMAMMATRSLSAPGTILRGFPWSTLPKDSLVVDVGGGVGSASLSIYDQYPTFRFVIQDRALVLEQAKQHWLKEHPMAISSATITFEDHDFFTAQPVKDADVFILRYILHDWPDDYASKILVQLGKAATPHTRLLVVDFILPGLQSESDGILKFDGPAVRAYMSDLMTAVFNGRERTQEDITSLLGGAGWKVDSITSPPNSLERHVIASPNES